MASFLNLTRYGLPMCTRLPTQQAFYGTGTVIWGKFKQPGDVWAYVTLALTNVVVGSRYRVERVSNGALVAEGEAADSTVSITVPWYGPSENNLVKIKIRKASASPYYRAYETQADITQSGATVFVAQELDE